MSCEPAALCVPAVDPVRVEAFWTGLLQDRIDDLGFALRFVPTSEPKTVQNLMHLDLTSSTPDHQRATVERALGLGARHRDVGQRADELHVVLGDVEGNEFCVVEAGNSFLADCGFVGAVACEGSRAVGCFWAAALEWPLVWDQDEETAIRSPHGGPKISWGGPPLTPRSGNRLWFELVASPGSDPDTEADRLLALGATRRTTSSSSSSSDGSYVDLSDPDGNLFRLVR